MKLQEFSNKLQEFINTAKWGSLDFKDEWSQTIISQYFMALGIGVEQAVGDVNGAYVFRIDDDRIRYMVTIPPGCVDGVDKHTFYVLCSDDVSDSISVKEFSIYLISKYRGVDEAKVRSMYNFIDTGLNFMNN